MGHFLLVVSELLMSKVTANNKILEACDVSELIDWNEVTQHRNIEVAV